MIMNVIKHYDNLIDENNDSFRDPKPLREYMDKWDGQEFINEMQLSGKESVLEIGIGTGRIAAKVEPLCLQLCGIDISPKTIDRAKENLNKNKNVKLICADFFEYKFREVFDVVYCSLTSMHFEDKQGFILKVNTLVKQGGRFVLSIDKNQSDYIDMETYKVKIYPDKPEQIVSYAEATEMHIERQFETEFAHVFVLSK